MTPRFDHLPLAIAAALGLGLGHAVAADLEVAGFSIGQQIANCPAPSLPIRNNECDVGIACRFPKQAVLVFGLPADRVGFGTVAGGKIVSVLASGNDAVQVAAAVANEHGAPDRVDGRNTVTNWGWLRGNVRLVISHLGSDPNSSFLVLDRYPTGPVVPVCTPRPQPGTR